MEAKRRRFLVRAFGWGLRQVAAICEMALLTRIKPEPVEGPIFIVGPPRSGTTLLYTALVYYLRVAFLTNRHNYYWRAPILTTRLLARRITDFRTPCFESWYGRVSGGFAPSEGWNFWYRWFPRGMEPYVPWGGLPPRYIRQMQQTLSGIQKVTGLPVLFKNIYNAMRIGSLAEAFPNACFLICRRDLVDSAQSLLRGRSEYHGDQTQWFSVPPREYESIRHGSPAEQVADQVFFVERQIDADRQRFGAEKFLEISYEEFCKHPRAVAANVQEFLRRRNICVETRGELPESFRFSSGCKIDPDDYAAIKARIETRLQSIAHPHG